MVASSTSLWLLLLQAATQVVSLPNKQHHLLRWEQVHAAEHKVSERIKTVHILSMGRQGSCFVQGMVMGEGIKHASIFEPSGGFVEGASIITGSKNAAHKRLQCLYDCTQCSSSIVKSDANEALQNFCHTWDSDQAAPYLVMKTTRIVDFSDLVEAVPRPLVEQGRFIVLLRDPRGVWASTKPMSTWAIHSIPTICALLTVQALTLPDLIALAGKERVMVAFYELWTQDVVAFSNNLAKFLQKDNDATAYAGRGQKTPAQLDPPSWVSQLVQSEITEIESNADCATYMARVGYQREGSHDYNGLKTSLEMLGEPLTPAETAILQSLRASRVAMEQDNVEMKEDMKLEFSYDVQRVADID